MYLRYERTLKAVRQKILERFREAKPIEGEANDAQHTLWMIEQVDQIQGQRAIDYHVGWITGKAHSMGMFMGSKIGELMEQDLALGLVEQEIVSEDGEALEALLEEMPYGISKSFLSTAERTRNEDIVTLVLDHYGHHGPDPKEQEIDDYPTPLIMAVSMGFIISARLTAEAWSDDPEYLNTKDKNGKTATEIARENGMIEIADQIESYLAELLKQ